MDFNILIAEHRTSPEGYGEDQYMYPYYMDDINSSAITEDEALELLTCLWIKTLTIVSYAT